VKPGHVAHAAAHKGLGFLYTRHILVLAAPLFGCVLRIPMCAFSVQTLAECSAFLQSHADSRCADCAKVVKQLMWGVQCATTARSCAWNQQGQQPASTIWAGNPVSCRQHRSVLSVARLWGWCGLRVHCLPLAAAAGKLHIAFVFARQVLGWRCVVWQLV
jgi:hypothetical protein